MMSAIAAYRVPAPIRPAAQLIDYAKTETRWLLSEHSAIDCENYPKLRAVFVAQWKAARDGSLDPKFFYTTARSMGNTLALLTMIRRARRYAQVPQ